MNFINHQLSISPLRCTAAVIGVAAVWLLMPEIVQAAVTFGEIGENVAENAKGVAKGVTLAGYASGAGMGVWGCVDMYIASIRESSPAHRLGLRPGDILIALGGQHIRSGDDYRDAFRRNYLSRRIHVQIVRDRRVLQARMVL